MTPHGVEATTMFNNRYLGKTVIVTGHTGFKGSWLCRWLLKLGAKVVGVSNSVPTKPSHFELLKLGSDMESLEIDIRDFDSTNRVFSTHRPDAVFHLAAQSLVGRSLINPLETIETNVLGTANILSCIHKTDSIRASVIITSDKCYENKEWEFGYREDDALGGKDPYSASKACSEIVFSSFFRSFLESTQTFVATARAGNVIGGGDWAENRIVPDCVRAWSEGKAAIIRSPNATRPWQHVLEPISGYLHLGSLLLSEVKSINGTSFNFGPPSDTIHSVADLVDLAKNVWAGVEWKSGADALKGKEANLLKLNCDRALNLLSWKPTLTFNESAKLTFEWYANYYSGKSTDVESLTDANIDEYTRLSGLRRAIWTLK